MFSGPESSYWRRTDTYMSRLGCWLNSFGSVGSYLTGGSAETAKLKISRNREDGKRVVSLKNLRTPKIRVTKSEEDDGKKAEIRIKDREFGADFLKNTVYAGACTREEKESYRSRLRRKTDTMHRRCGSSFVSNGIYESSPVTERKRSVSGVTQKTERKRSVSGVTQKTDKNRSVSGVTQKNENKRSVSYTIRSDNNGNTERKLTYKTSETVYTSQPKTSFKWSPLPLRRQMDVCFALLLDDLNNFDTYEKPDFKTPSHVVTTERKTTPFKRKFESSLSNKSPLLFPKSETPKNEVVSPSMSKIGTPKTPAKTYNLNISSAAVFENENKCNNLNRNFLESQSEISEDEILAWEFPLGLTPLPGSEKPTTNPLDTPTKHSTVETHKTPPKNPLNPSNIGKDLCLESLHDFSWLRNFDGPDRMVLEAHVIWSILTLMVVLLAVYSIPKHVL